MVSGGSELVFVLMLCHLPRLCGVGVCPRLVEALLCVLILVCVSMPFECAVLSVCTCPSAAQPALCDLSIVPTHNPILFYEI